MKKWYVMQKCYYVIAIKLIKCNIKDNRLRMIEMGVQSVARNRETINE